VKEFLEAVLRLLDTSAGAAFEIDLLLA